MPLVNSLHPCSFINRIDNATRSPPINGRWLKLNQEKEKGCRFAQVLRRELRPLSLLLTPSDFATFFPGRRFPAGGLLGRGSETFLELRGGGGGLSRLERTG